MKFLLNKKILVIGLHNKYSIAYGISKIIYKQGANLAFTYKNKKYKNKIKDIAKKFNSNIVLKCNMKKDSNIKNLFAKLKKIWLNFDGFIHSIAYLNKYSLKKKYIDSINLKDFNKSHHITSYSFSAIAKYCQFMLNKNSSLLTISYLGSKKFIPYYNFMGLAKASLESNVRYLACSLGPRIRVNAISSGPIKTISSYGIKNFKKIYSINKNFSPIKRNVSITEIGNTAAFLISNLSSGITGQIIYVDGGFNIVGLF
ncbi:enoyl-ACP reductase [Buchnera aphidicola]|uniref:enoyl-ACP reductase FabI n=1 Tax=Buchnera aphidicola TaxID=9 RepID=UPI002236F65A|nr:enoyl-ACP reductase [Buchnera aphidicola]MCW5197679.1 enoyl-ACP reductase [Buchnera aphidicola (Chaitophorus viminalis)]